MDKILILLGLIGGYAILKTALAWPPIALIVQILTILATIMGIIIVTVTILAARLIRGGYTRWA